ncbi:hypothetical protein MHZ92_01375 [Sporosarcina sp. ACRSL]|uniref:hypothetical protein n=1 Tax=Sporosarcina sp. ACRSL TaxID=2918215 RepID=UPI001EF6A118|nr:hypothetical protein [Sporosarcina sp. ACRSL]MCG7342761.1 hypothetical protein [Sporosarcina sp. ACRSL]
MKIILRIVGLLIILNSVLLYMHYSQMADASGTSHKESRYVQEIEVINREDALFVKHHFRNLDHGRHELVFPIESRNRACLLETESSCSRFNENVTAILEGEENEQSISYEIPKSGHFESRKLFKEPFAVLRNAKPDSTILHMTDESGIGGMWVSGLEMVGFKKMDMVDYTMFKGNGKVTDLYWQRNSLPQVYKGDRLSIFGNSIDNEVAEELHDRLVELGAQHIAIVLDPQGKPLQSSRFLISERPVTELTDAVLESGVRSLYAIPGNEQLVAGLIASIYIDAPIGTERAKAVFESLKHSLTTTQYEMVRSRLAEQKGERLNAAALDEVIGEVSGWKTSFVQKNVEGNYPFLLEDSRTVHMNGEAQEDIQVVIKDKQTLYPANKLLTRNGYSMSSNESSIYIENENEKFRFSLRDPFYVLNEKRYELRERPYVLIGNEYYFEEDALRRLFQLSIQKNEETIVVTSLAGGESS